MTSHPFTFAEVLEDEYRYFYRDDPFREVRFEEQHVREIEGLAKFLESVERRHCKWPSRWKVWADAVAAQEAAPDDGAASRKAVVEALNKLVERPALLNELIADKTFEQQLATSGECLRLLLRIPNARRLLLAREELRPVLATDQLIDEFASHSAAIRVLVAKNGFREVFRLYPALLSTIADDQPLRALLASSEDARAALASLFKDVRPGAWWQRLIAAFQRHRAARTRDRIDASQDASLVMKFISSGSTRTSAEAQHIEPVLLSRFNATLLETAYAEYIASSQIERALHTALYAKETAALCLSGGGIRSATFNLGVLQGLADHRLLNRFQYISTVSGGGYVGSWLSSWTRRHREGAVGVAKDLSRRAVDPANPEVKPIAHLREYSSYLAPRNTAFSLDTWTLLATYIRNLLLNWTMFLPFLVALFAFPRLLEAWIRRGMELPWDYAGSGAIAFASIALISIECLRPRSALPIGQPSNADKGSKFLWTWLFPLQISAVLFSVHWAAPDNMFIDDGQLLAEVFGFGAAAGAWLFAIQRSWTEIVASDRPKRTWKERARDTVDFALRVVVLEQRTRLEIMFAAISGGIGGFLLYECFKYAFPIERLSDDLGLEVYVCLSIPLFLSTFFVAITLLVGLMTSFTKDYDREWWARSGAALVVTSCGYALGATAVVILPMVIFEAPALTAPIGGISGLVSYLCSRALQSGSIKDENRKRLLMPILRTAAGISLLFIIAGISIVTTAVIPSLNEAVGDRPLLAAASIPAALRYVDECVAAGTWRHLLSLRTTAHLTVLLLAAGAAAIAMVMSRFLNVNVYSMHGMYRNRLIRAYLGASRWARRPDPFTGFDPYDDVRMFELRPEMLWPSSFIDFDGFVSAVPTKPLWKRFAPDVCNRVCAYDVARSLEERRKMRDAAQTVLVNEINRLMLCHDLEHDVPAKPSLALLCENRGYLDREFEGMLRTYKREVLLPRDEYGHEPPSKPVSGRPPLHIINTALNLVQGRNLAWQERKADSFTISPLYCGNRMVGYRDSAQYAKAISLGSAMAISGAAVSPNMGAKSSPAFTCLMTLLNARLGAWIGNPKKSRYDKESPHGSIGALFNEAVGRTNENHDFVFLSDGGHFENLGLYEMVKRRCKFIIVCDATADSGYAFGDLANAIRKIRIDLGVSIEPLTTKYIGPEAGEELGKYCALGDIRYDNVDGTDVVGRLIYVKPCVYADCPPDVRNYGRKEKTFPHETTADQFFSESQFESYRALGRHIIGRIAGDKPGDHGAWLAPDISAFFDRATDYVFEKRPRVGEPPARVREAVQ